MVTQEIIDLEAETLKEEVRRQQKKFNSEYNSPHEMWGVLMEEIDEAMDELRANNLQELRKEIKQCASVCLRWLAETHSSS